MAGECPITRGWGAERTHGRRTEDRVVEQSCHGTCRGAGAHATPAVGGGGGGAGAGGRRSAGEVAGDDLPEPRGATGAPSGGVRGGVGRGRARAVYGRPRGLRAPDGLRA